MNLIGKPAPEFTATAIVDGQVVRDFSLASYRDRYVVLFFYPEDFTGVCGSEVHAFQARLADFEARDAAVIGCSINTATVHQQYLKTPASEGGAEGVTYPLIADTNRMVADRFGTLNGQFDYNEYGLLEATSDLMCQRGTFIIDKGGTVWFQSYHFMPIGRDIDGVIRELDAIRRLQIDGQVCMPNWKG